MITSCKMRLVLENDLLTKVNTNFIIFFLFTRSKESLIDQNYCTKRRGGKTCVI